EANVTLGLGNAPFRSWAPARPIYTHLRHLPGSRLLDCQVRDSILAEGCYLRRVRVDQSVVGLRTPVRPGTPIDHSVILGADLYEDSPPPGLPPLGVGRDVVLRRVIV